MATDDSFKRPGAVPFKWEISPGVPKVAQPHHHHHHQPHHHPHHHHHQSQPSNHRPSPKPPQKLRPPPAGLYFYPPVESATTRSSVRSKSRLRSDSMRLDRPSPHRPRSVSPSCFPSPLMPKRKDDKKSIRSTEAEPDYSSDLETLSRWSTSTRRSLSPFCNSPSSIPSGRSSPRPVGDAEWAAFGLF